MDYTVLLLVILLQLSTIFGSEVVLERKDCGNNWVANSYSSHVNFPSMGGRKLLQEDLNKNSTSQGDSKHVSSNHVGIFAGGALLVCCAIVCPCFYGKRRKTTAHTVLEKDSNSRHAMHSEERKVDLASSFEPSVSDKIPSSPLRVPQSPSRFSMSPKLSRLQSLHLNLSQVSKATRNFSETLQIGEGGFGTVYRANLDDGLVVAVKRAKREHFESLRTEFSSEVELLAKIDHRNLVKLLGYIDKGNERILITEFVPNGTLREHLDGLFGKILDFNQRLEIAIDVAHGLTYLHLYAEKQIIHRDVKSSNILLTERMRAKVADFGFAKLGPVSNDHTHISTKVKGTVEILTGRRPVEMKKTPEERVTLRWAFRKYNEGNMVELLDPLMQEAVKTDIVMKMLDLAFSCAAPVRSDRPDMKAVCEQLWPIRADYLKSSSETARRE
ncbi:unnamed protein product [Vicia faba]|uniref:Protein kinase domain-containing protein n=1 Tax=Vicia faba TaxID=3906 RepID=A0AAV1AJ83_VICFA|nr:unnamed protein product [Vicia faba]